MLKRSKTSVGSQIGRISALGRQQVRMSSDEVKKAQEAADKGAAGAGSEPTIFARILNKEIPANIIHEDEKVLSEINYKCPIVLLNSLLPVLGAST